MMRGLLVQADTGIPIHFILKSQLDDWLTTQSSLIQSIVGALKTTNTKHFFIPQTQSTNLAAVVSVVESFDSMWLAGDLAKQLPKGIYQIQGSDAFVEQQALSFVLGAYQFSVYKSLPKVEAQLAVADQDIFKRVMQSAEAIYLVRDLVNTPAADMMPQHLAEAMIELSDRFDGQFSQIIGDELLEQNYPTIHMVGRASDNKPRLLDLTWGDETHPKLTLVGKGVCFDSGGLDLKPASGMRNMKKDMGGAAHVIGLAQMIMAAKLPVRLRVLVPAVENAVSRNAFRPGDVIKTRKGITVEIDNTDAEGRLVLCDALAEAQSESPDLLVDFATLTGACRVALGTELPGFFSTDTSVAAGLIEHGVNAQDPVWQLPLFGQYKDLFKSDVADMANSGATPYGGAITAALYLKEFIEPEQTPWVHFDVMAWNTRSLPGRPAGGEGLGLRASFDYLLSRYVK
ncbi:cytosol aminopeptidase [Pseudoalteromonas sp. CIP111854]|uniref:Cytosol aminopeptidase n=2 Tax=Pseudoalteromonas holothuriae TaxID=2963714 RepID=A0A9W4R068_9GAMM|nr:cytosol aminopeptidase [Pseudoalteromonas sp. CIP111854]